ncbi:condensation domain-containing protein [Dactylosporangium sp. McL0621]|uniref:condensation domain-containing protein n=1 Tax=Dactylosporangium sp. McL0621 TaxID=3415678 RepID=UPI003CEA64DD
METYPATVGQLSVWHDLVRIPAERRWEANLQFTWDLPDGAAEQPVWDALARLARRHGSLRTRYVVDENGLPRQWPSEDTAAVHEQVRQGTADAAERAEAERRELHTAIDVRTELPWRALLLLDAGRPAALVVTLHHMAADGVAGLIMRDDFLRLLAGEELPAAPGPRELALAQQGADGGRLRTAERHWRRTLAAAPRVRSAEGAGGNERIGATLRTGIPMPQAHAMAATTGVSLSSVLLAVYHRALCAAGDETVHLMFSMSNNRYDDTQAAMVTSLNQWVPLLLDAGTSKPAEPLATVAERVHWKHFGALKHGVYSPAAAAAARAEQPDVDLGYHYNPMLTPPGFPSADRAAPPAVEYYEPARATGPGFYVIARGLTSLELDLRVGRPGWDGPRVRTFVDRVTAELHALSPAASGPSW